MDRHLSRVPIALALVQVADALGNELVPRRVLDRHLDRLAVPAAIRSVLPFIKLISSAGLLLGLRVPPVGAMTSIGLIGYYTAAAGFHVRAGDRPVFAAPAAVLGAGAAGALFGVYVPAVRRSRDSGAGRARP